MMQLSFGGNKMERSISLDSIQMLKITDEMGISTVWDRYEKQQPQCGFGETGLCCRHCLQGPCRIDPFGSTGPKVGICGASADTIVARGLARNIAAGTASHSAHAKHLAHTMLKWSRGEAPDYGLRDLNKFYAVLDRVGISREGKTDQQLAGELARMALDEFSEREESPVWLKTTVTKSRFEKFEKLGIVPLGLDSTVAEIMHRTTNGVDADPVNILLASIKCAIGDYSGMYMGTDLSDILFGTPSPVMSTANLGSLKATAVNVAVHGHNPVLSEVMVAEALKMTDEAKAAGAPDGFNLVGICCTGHEVIMRHGIPYATNSLSQELAIVTGALDAAVVDYQCIMPSLPEVAKRFHTAIITTMPITKIPGAVHVEFDEKHAGERAREVLRIALEAYKKRDPNKVNIPSQRNNVIAGMSAESIIKVLSILDPNDPLKPLIDNIVNGNIMGVCLFAGCNDVKITQDKFYITLVKELAANNILILCTGCAAGSFARHGLLTPDATEKYAGPGLKAVLTALGQAAGLGGPLPMALHTGSCVDNSRAASIATAIANRLGVDVSMLPVVATAPEAAMEKALSIGTWAVAMGLPTHVGVIPRVTGRPLVVDVLTKVAKDLLGGYFIVEPDPKLAAEKLVAAIKERRQGLGI